MIVPFLARPLLNADSSQEHLSVINCILAVNNSFQVAGGRRAFLDVLNGQLQLDSWIIKLLEPSATERQALKISHRGRCGCQPGEKGLVKRIALSSLGSILALEVLKNRACFRTKSERARKLVELLGFVDQPLKFLRAIFWIKDCSA